MDIINNNNVLLATIGVKEMFSTSDLVKLNKKKWVLIFNLYSWFSNIFKISSRFFPCTSCLIDYRTVFFF